MAGGGWVYPAWLVPASTPTFQDQLRLQLLHRPRWFFVLRFAFNVALPTLPPAQPPPTAPNCSPTEPYACRRSMAQLHRCMDHELVTCRGRAARPIQAPWAQLPPRDRSTTTSLRWSRCALPVPACTVPLSTQCLPAPAVLEPLTPASCAGADVDRWGRLHAGLCEQLCVTLCLRIFIFIIV